MKPLNDHTILYDDQCPLCDRYTSGFVNAGMLDKNGRREFSKAGALLDRIDRERACDEIALLNRRTGEVTYGIDSLMKILANSFPLLKPLFSNAVFYAAMKKLYAFISYNRKVIIPGRASDGIVCEPTFKVSYRTAYLVFAWIATAAVLHVSLRTLTPLTAASSFGRELLICGGQIIFQAAVVGLNHKDQTFNYLGNLMTISFAGSLALMILLPVAKAGFFPILTLACFGVVVSLMLLEHMRRIRLLRLTSILTVTWILYWLQVLACMYFLP
ncbi:MAG TPA: hypothetical protein VEB86_15370 [Chryseosolibacter sp.]|nr:hypothetical protein [Chryseosolibacter sp.]